MLRRVSISLWLCLSLFAASARSQVVIGTADGGLGAANSAATGVPLFTAGVVTITSTNGSGNFLRALGTVAVASGKTFTASNTLTLTGTDGSTLAVGSGGTLGTGAFQSQTVLTGTSGELSVSNGGVGATTLSLPSTLTFTGKTITGGTYASGAFNGTFVGNATGATAQLAQSVPASDGVSRYLFLSQSSDATNAPFGMVIGNTNFEGRLDEAMYLGYNVATGGGRYLTSEPRFSFQVEQNYKVGANNFVESYFEWVNADGTGQRRPIFWQFDRATGVMTSMTIKDQGISWQDWATGATYLNWGNTGATWNGMSGQSANTSLTLVAQNAKQAGITLTATGGTFLTGGESNMTILAGTGPSRGMTLQISSNTGVATTFLSASAAAIVTLPAYTSNGMLSTSGGTGLVGVTATTGSGNAVLSASPTLTGTVAAASLSLSSLTSGRIPFATTAGLLTDSSTLTFATPVMTISGANPAITLNDTQAATVGWKYSAVGSRSGQFEIGLSQSPFTVDFSISTSGATTIGRSALNAGTSTLTVFDQFASTGATQLLVQGGAAAADATTNKLFLVNQGGGTTALFSVRGNGQVTAEATTEAGAGSGALVVSGGASFAKKIITASTLTTASGVTYDFGADVTGVTTTFVTTEYLTVVVNGSTKKIALVTSIP